jgi:hypothetical protein
MSVESGRFMRVYACCPFWYGWGCTMETADDESSSETQLTPLRTKEQLFEVPRQGRSHPDQPDLDFLKFACMSASVPSSTQLIQGRLCHLLLGMESKGTCTGRALPLPRWRSPHRAGRPLRYTRTKAAAVHHGPVCQPLRRARGDRCPSDLVAGPHRSLPSARIWHRSRPYHLRAHCRHPANDRRS